MSTIDDLPQAIAVSLNLEREAAGWTLEALAAELGLSEQTLGRYLTRRTRSIPVDVLTRACAVIGVPLTVVIERAEARLANPPTRPPREDPQAQAARVVAEARAAAAAGEDPAAEAAEASRTIPPGETGGAPA